MGRLCRTRLWFLGLGALFHPLLAPPSGLAQSLEPIPLDCRLAGGAWQSCQMEVIQLGRHWFLKIGGDRFEFTHDGTGKVRMGIKGVWEEVTPSWSEDRTLCWGRLCARGEIPLD